MTRLLARYADCVFRRARYVVRGDLHTLADAIQRDVAAIADYCAASFFGHAEAPAPRPGRP